MASRPARKLRSLSSDRSMMFFELFQPRMKKATLEKMVIAVKI